MVTSPNNEVFTDSDFSIPGDRPASVGDVELLNAEGEPLITVDGYVAGRNYVVRDEGNFLRCLASARLDMAFERMAAGRLDQVSLEANAAVDFSFEITGEAMPVSLSHDFGAAPGQDVSRSVTLSGPSGDLYVFEDPKAPGGDSSP